MKNREMRGAAGGEMDFVVSGGAERIVSGLEPFEASEREPAIGLQKIRDVLLAPGGQFFLPGRVLREGGDGKKRPECCEQQNSWKAISESHGEL